MATYNITGSNCSSFYGGELVASSSCVGTTWDGNYVRTVVCRYHFKTDAYGATSFTFKTTRGYCDVRGSSSSDDNIGNMRFAIGTNATQYSTTKSSSVGTAITNYKYGGSGTGYVAGSSSTKLLPNTDYYLWVFPNAGFSSYTRFGIGNCTVTTSGSYGVASTITASNATLGNSQTITLTNTVSGVTNTLKVKYGNTVVQTPVNNVTSSGKTYTQSWTPSVSMYAPLKTDGKTMSVTLECTTKYGSATWGTSTKTITLTIPNSCAPDLAVSSTEFDNSIISSANIDEYVQGYSKLKATLATTLKYGASVSSYKIVYNGVTTTKSSSSATYTITTDNVVTAYDTGTGNASATVTVTDTRGFTNTNTVTATFGPICPYSKPVLSNISVFRSAIGGAPADDGTYLRAYADASVSSVNGKNSIQVFKVFYRTRSGIFDAGTTLTSGTASILNVLDSDKTYIAKITLQDKITQALSQPVEASFTIPAATWAIKFNLKTENDKKTIIAAGIGKAPEAEKVLEIPSDWDIVRGVSPSDKHVVWDSDSIPISRTTGTLPLDRGGTGATSASAARTNLGLGYLSTVSSVGSWITMSNHNVVSGGSVSANTYVTFSKSVSKSGGWYPLGIVGVRASGSGSTSIPILRFYLDDRTTGSCTATVLVRNVASSAATPTISVDILWAKTG